MNLKPSSLLSTKYFYILSLVNILVCSIFLLFCYFILASKEGIDTAYLVMKVGIVFILVVDCVTVFFSNLWIKNLSYELKESSLTINKGIFSKTEQNIPNDKVTDFVLYRSLFDRYLGIGSIMIQTAGGSTPGGYEGELSGLENYKDIHKRLRDRLINKNNSDNSNEDKRQLSLESKLLEDILSELKIISSKLK